MDFVQLFGGAFVVAAAIFAFFGVVAYCERPTRRADRNRNGVRHGPTHNTADREDRGRAAASISALSWIRTKPFGCHARGVDQPRPLISLEPASL